MPIFLEGDSSAVELNDFAGPRSPGSEASAMDSSDVASPQSLEREQEPHRGFDERIPLSLSLPDASGRVESDDGSDSDTTKRFTFRKRKLGPEGGSLLSNVPLSSHPQEDNRVTDRERQRLEGDRGRRKRRRHNDRDRAVERDGHSLSGVLTGGDSGDAEGIRGERRQMGLTPRRRNANDTSDLASKREGRHRSVSSSASSSSDESQRNSGLVASPENTARSLSQSARRRRQRGLHLLSSTPSEDLTSDREESYGHDDLVVADRPSRPDPGTLRSTPKLQETKGMARSNPDGAHMSADDGEDGSQDEPVWEHGPLLNYKVVNGKPLVLVPWYPTWEPPDEYPKEEVERVKQQYESGALGKRRGRRPLKVVGGKFGGSAYASTRAMS
jgi:hypothetical protein